MTPAESDATTSSREITEKSKSSFYYSFLLLPKEKRDAMFAVYAACRRIDDCVDEAPDSKSAHHCLAAMKRLLDEAYSGSSQTPLGHDLASAVATYSIPRKWFDELILGVEMDVTQNRYATIEELRTYCYRVASVVGMICIEIFGFSDPAARDYAETLGHAMQLTNILRDVGDDARRNRIYLPLEDLARFSYSEDDLLAAVHDDRFHNLMEFQFDRAQKTFEAARSLYPKADRATLYPAEIMRSVYEKVLRKVKSQGYRVFDGRVRLSKASKLSSALGIYLRDGLL